MQRAPTRQEDADVGAPQQVATAHFASSRILKDMDLKLVKRLLRACNLRCRLQESGEVAGVCPLRLVDMVWHWVSKP